jgi:hypothetical protein
MQPDQNANGAKLKRTRFQIDCGESLDDIVGDVSSMINSPANSGRGD